MYNVWGYHTTINLFGIVNNDVNYVENYFTELRELLGEKFCDDAYYNVVDLSSSIHLYSYGRIVSLMGHFDLGQNNAYIDIISKEKYNSDAIIKKTESYFKAKDSSSYLLKRPLRKIYDSVDDLMLRKPPRLFFD